MKKKNKILKLWKSGMSKRAIGLKVGVHRSYVQKIIKQLSHETPQAN
jgi:transposase